MDEVPTGRVGGGRSDGRTYTTLTPQVQASTVSILIVDDHAPNLVALEAILESLGHRIVRASSGEDAFRCMLAEDFAVILMDVRMPGIDGFTTASIIRTRDRNRHIPIIFLTASSSDAELLRGYQYGAVDFMVKPFEPLILRSKVAVLVELFQQREQIREQAARLHAAELATQAHESDLRWRQLVDAMPVPVWCMKPDGELFYANERWLELTGISAGNTPFLKAIHEADVPSLTEAWRAAQATGSAFGAEFRIMRAWDGAAVWHLGRVVPYYDAQRTLIGWIATAIDVDAQKRTQREQVEAVRARDEFLSIAGHELRTPLTSLQLTVQGLLRQANRDLEQPASKLVAKLALAEQLVRRQGRLIEDLLDVSRITEGRLALEVEEFDLGELITEIVARCLDQASHAGCPITFDSAQVVRGSWDRARVEQVIVNLLANAMKYGHGCPIEIHLDATETHARVEVVDHGIGIAPADQAHLFERFFRASTGAHFGGFGLGLWISRQIVTALEGTLRVSSVLNEGATFTVALPLVATK